MAIAKLFALNTNAIIAKYNIKKNLYSQFSQQITGRSHFNSGVVHEHQRFNQTITVANVVMRLKVTLTKTFGMKTSAE